MDTDIFAEVKRIESEAEAVLSQAEADREVALERARADAEAYRAESAGKLETESRLLRTEHEAKLAKETEHINADFDQEKRRLDTLAEERTEELADWVVKRFLSEGVEG